MSGWKDLLNDISRQTDVKHQDRIIKDALYSGQITIVEYWFLVKQVFAAPIRSVVMSSEDYIGLPNWKEKICDCGAKHTSFPKHHYHWCKTQEK
jgi:hypothetical protein